MAREAGNHGTGEQVIHWLLHVNRDTDPWNGVDFLAAWEEGDAESEWPEFYQWLDKQANP